MPSYELALILKKMAKPQTAAALKRVAVKILDNKGILFDIMNLGTRKTPFKMTSHGQKITEASYFVMKFDSSTASLKVLVDEYERDVDVVIANIFKDVPELAFNCTLDEELKPPAYRQNVKDMIEEGRKREIVYNMKTGLSYNPWSR